MRKWHCGQALRERGQGVSGGESEIARVSHGARAESKEALLGPGCRAGVHSLHQLWVNTVSSSAAPDLYPVRLKLSSSKGLCQAECPCVLLHRLDKM